MKKNAFTLAETLITLSILGVVAAITVPSLINKQIESANRTKVKKAMAVYEKALNQMIIDNDVKGDVSALNGNTCETTRPYFKTIENGDNNCQFKTADRIWWDISDIQNPVISLKDKITASNLSTMKTNAESLETDKTSFAMIGYIDTNGILRINDKGVAKDGETVPTAKNKTYLDKLYGFMNNEKIEDNSNKIKYCSETIDDLDTQKTSCVYRTNDGGGAAYMYNNKSEPIGYMTGCDTNIENCESCQVYSADNIFSCNEYGYTNCTGYACCKEGKTWHEPGYCE